MELVAIVIGLALLEYFYFLLRCGMARGRLGVPAPSTVGNPEFERYLRVQYNTIEQLVLFIPSAWLFGWFVSPLGAAWAGAVFIVGRALYARAYLVDPAKRGPGFGLTILSNLVLTLGGLVGALIAYF